MARFYSLRLLCLGLLALTPPLALGQNAAAEPSLSQELEAFSAKMAEQFPAEVRAKFAQGVQEVRDLGIAESSLGVGGRVPDATLIGAEHEPIELAKLWAEGPVVLAFYRGGWCPYCNLQLKALQRSLAQIENAGATLVAVTPELPEKASMTIEKNTLGYLVLTDPDNALARQLGIVFTLPEVIRPIYDQRIGLAQFNGNDKNELPLAATYVIDRSGVIRWVFRDADYTRRAEPSDIVQAVRRVGSN